MKQIITLGLAIMIALASSAQKNVTKFLGIPVDGTKTAMIQKLKAKGYSYNAKLDYLEGEFNGRDVHIHIITNNNKVWRIMVTDAHPTRNQADIRIRFNTLCQQFSENTKYVVPSYVTESYEIKEDEDIMIQMGLYNKRYEAGYWQVTEADKDSIQKYRTLTQSLQDKAEKEISNMESNEMKQNLLNLLTGIDYILDISKKTVWFMIAEDYGQYYIIMYYDNEKNKANGEDL